MPDEIRFAGLDKFGLVNEFPRDKGDGCYKRREIVSKPVVSFLYLGTLDYMVFLLLWRLKLTENQHGVIDEEVLHIEWVQRGVAVASHNHNHPCQSEVGAVWLAPSIVWQTLPVQALLLGCLVVENEGRAHHDVGDDTARSHQIDQPAQDFGRSISDLQERQAGKDHGNGKGEQWNTILGAVAEESWCATLEGHAVQGTCRTVSVRVTGRKDGSAEQGVDQVREPIDPEILHGDHVWRGRGSSATAGLSRNDAHKSRVGIGNNDTTS